MKLRDIKHLFTEDFLGLIGLEVKTPRRSRWLGMATLFSAGVLIGASAVLVLVPRSPKEPRKDLPEKGAQNPGKDYDSPERAKA